MASSRLCHGNRACGLADGSVAKWVKKISYKGYRFPPEIIRQAIWLYLRFALSFRDVEKNPVTSHQINLSKSP